MTTVQKVVTILCCIAATMLTRFLPFLVFSDKRPVPSYVQYLGKVLPCASFGMLVVYCLKDVNVLNGSHGIPEAAAVILTAILYLWKKKSLLAILGGTVFYMVLVQVVFA